MNIDAMLEFIDEAIYAKTESHLNDLQRKVLEGVLNNQKYTDIASEYGRSEGHVKDVGYELLKMLSNIFSEPVNKGNLNSVLGRQGELNLSLGEQIVNGQNLNKQSINAQIIGCINLNNNSSQDDSEEKIMEESNLSPHQIDKINKLKKLGLESEAIADILDIPLDMLQDNTPKQKNSK